MVALQCMYTSCDIYVFIVVHVFAVKMANKYLPLCFLSNMASGVTKQSNPPCGQTLAGAS